MNKSLTEIERVFKALADTTRLRILGLLLTGEVCVCHIHESLRISQPKASRHLAYLRRSGLVDTRREGLWVHYRLAAVRKDADRLRKKTGCCLPVAVEMLGCLCCAGNAAPSERSLNP